MPRQPKGRCYRSFIHEANDIKIITSFLGIEWIDLPYLSLFGIVNLLILVFSTSASSVVSLFGII